MTSTVTQLLAVAGGGALGALGRYSLSLWLAPLEPGKLNYATLVANVIGSFLIGLAFVFIVEKWHLPPVFRHLLMVGFLGAFTTFSTFALEVLVLLQQGQTGGALAYIAASVLLSLLAVAAI
jgi:CrcB protein